MSHPIASGRLHPYCRQEDPGGSVPMQSLGRIVLFELYSQLLIKGLMGILKALINKLVRFRHSPINTQL